MKKSNLLLGFLLAFCSITYTQNIVTYLPPEPKPAPPAQAPIDTIITVIDAAKNYKHCTYAK